jgi:hypothetical protein
MRRYWIRFNKKAKRIEETVTINGKKPSSKYRLGWIEVTTTENNNCCNIQAGCTKHISLSDTSWNIPETITSGCQFQITVFINGVPIIDKSYYSGTINSAINNLNNTYSDIFNIVFSFIPFPDIGGKVKMEADVPVSQEWTLSVNYICE